jgi:hypothetical protein
VVLSAANLVRIESVMVMPFVCGCSSHDRSGRAESEGNFLSGRQIVALTAAP